MILRPIIQPHIRPVAVAGTGVFLLAENGCRLLQGRLCEALLPLVDGRRTADEIVDALQPDFPASEIYYALLMLEKKGYVTESDQQAPHGNAAFWSLYGLDARHVECKLAATRVSIKALGTRVSEEPLTDALKAVGVGTGGEAHLTVVLVDDYLDSGLETINLNAIAYGRRWILAKPTGSNPLVGPLFSPLNSGCWECLAYRLREHRNLERFLRKGSDVSLSVPACDTPLTRQIAYDILATEILKWIADEQQCGIYGTVLSVDTRSWHTERHVLVRRPQCAACGTDQYRGGLKPVPIELDHRRVVFTADGGYRCNTPEETVQRYGHHVSPITGAVSALYRHQNATNSTSPSTTDTRF